jgi:hypothetical protein
MRRVKLYLLPLWAALWSPALAGPQDTITAYTVKAQEFEARDEARIATHEVGTLRAWLGEAQAYLAQDNEALLEQALDRIESQARLIEALIARAAAEDAATKAHAQADAREKEAALMRNAAFELEQKLAELEKQGQQK